MEKTAPCEPWKLSEFPTFPSVRIRPARLADPPLSWPSAFPVICRRLAKLKRFDRIGACRDSREVCRSLGNGA